MMDEACRPGNSGFALMLVMYGCRSNNYYSAFADQAIKPNELRINTRH